MGLQQQILKSSRKKYLEGTHNEGNYVLPYNKEYLPVVVF